MANEYPLHLERELELIYEKLLEKLFKKVLKSFKKLYKRELKTDGDVYSSLENELFQFLNEFFEKSNIDIQIEKVASLLDAWAVAKTKNSLKAFKKITPKGFGDLATVKFSPDDPAVINFIDDYTKFNKQLVKSLGHEYIPAIGNLARQSFSEGRALTSYIDKDGIRQRGLTEILQSFTDGEFNKAKFWARDQVGDAYSSFTKMRQTQAGIDKYIWRTVGDSHVRGLKKTDKTSHIALEGKVFNWKTGASKTGQLSKPGAKHGGEDYNCRCVSEPYIEGISEPGPEDTVQFLTPEDLARTQKTQRPTFVEKINLPEQKAGKTPATISKVKTPSEPSKVKSTVGPLPGQAKPKKDPSIYDIEAEYNKKLDNIKLPSDEFNMVREYTASGFGLLNKNIIKAKKQGEQLSRNFEVKKKIMNSGLDKMPNYEGTVFRGMRWDEAKPFNKFAGEFEKGGYVNFPAFTSTSIDARVARKFKGGLSTFGIMFEIKAKKGKWAGKFSSNPGEKEVIFKTDSKFKVIDIKNNSNKNVMGQTFHEKIITLEEIEGF